MPWTVQRDNRCAAAKPWSVTLQSDNSIVACHATRRKALRQQAALYATEASRMSEPRAVADGGKKDKDGKTVPRDLRFWPYKNAAGDVDLPHTRNALARIPQSDAPASAKETATRKAQAALKAANKGRSAPEDGEVPEWVAREQGVRTRVSSEMWTDAGIEIRRKPDSMRVEGYAAVFGQPSLPMPFVEQFKSGAFKRSLEERPVKMFLNHNDNIVLGYTKAGTLRVSEDSRGLPFDGELPDNEWGRPVADAIDRGDIDNMSFTFKATRDDWTNGYKNREVLEARLFEISPITSFAAYPSTTVARRSLIDLAGYLVADVDVLQRSIDKLANGEPLAVAEAELLEAAIVHLEPQDENTEEAESNALPPDYFAELRTRYGLAS